jgi:hypothetical protein
MMSSQSLLGASVFNWPILILALIAIALGIKKVIAGYGSKESVAGETGGRFDILLVMGVACLFCGLTGYLFELYRASASGEIMGNNLFALVCTMTDSTEKTVAFASGLMRCSSVMMVSLFASMLIAALWFVAVSAHGDRKKIAKRG